MLTQLFHMNSMVLLAAVKRGQISAGFVVICIATVLTIGLAIGAYFLMRNRQPSTDEQNRSLFKELCRAHQLTSAQSSLILRLAKGLKLSCPATLFVDSSAWRIPEQSGADSLDRKEWEKLQTIQKMLFAPALATVART